MKKTKVEVIERCVECGQYEPHCEECGVFFDSGKPIMCDGYHHYHISCYNRKIRKEK